MIGFRVEPGRGAPAKDTRGAPPQQVEHASRVDRDLIGHILGDRSRDVARARLPAADMLNRSDTRRASSGVARARLVPGIPYVRSAVANRCRAPRASSGNASETFGTPSASESSLRSPRREAMAALDRGTHRAANIHRSVPTSTNRSPPIGTSASGRAASVIASTERPAPSRRSSRCPHPPGGCSRWRRRRARLRPARFPAALTAVRDCRRRTYRACRETPARRPATPESARRS